MFGQIVQTKTANQMQFKSQLPFLSQKNYTLGKYITF